jgi:hypothetical protein
MQEISVKVVKKPNSSWDLVLYKSEVSFDKIYDASTFTLSNDILSILYLIKCNDGIDRYYPSNLFINLDEYRESQINNILHESDFRS